MNSFERIAGLLFSGAVVRLAGAGLAILVGIEAMEIFSDSMNQVQMTLDRITEN